MHNDEHRIDKRNQDMRNHHIRHQAQVYDKIHHSNHASPVTAVVPPVTPPTVAFSYEPATAVMAWMDSGGSKTGDLAAYRATGDQATTTTVVLQNKGLTSITLGTGFVALQVLNVGTNAITNLNLARVPKLVMLTCANNLLTTLDLSACPLLVNLQAQGNQLTVLDLSHNTALTVVKAGDNLLTEINVTMLPNLAVLEVPSNLLTACDISQNPLLSTLLCYNMNVPWIHIDNNPRMAYIDLGGNATSQAAIDDLLIRLDGFGLSGGHAALFATAVPGPAGQTAKNNLLARQWNLQIDGG